jgi:hypothetical protein
MRLACNHPYLTMSQASSLERRQQLIAVDQQLQAFFAPVQDDGEEELPEGLPRPAKALRRKAGSAPAAPLSIGDHILAVTFGEAQKRLTRFSRQALTRLEGLDNRDCPICLEVSGFPLDSLPTKRGLTTVLDGQTTTRQTAIVLHCGHFLCKG